MLKLLCLGLVAVSAGCAAGPSKRELASCLARVESFANPAAGARADFRPNVLFADLRLGPEAVGYGAAGGRSDEITIADGVLRLARPDGNGGFRQRSGVQGGEGAYMLQLVNVEVWGPQHALPVINSLDALGREIGAQVQLEGCRGATKLAFRLKGRVRRAEWSLDTLPQRGDFVAEGQDVVVAGLFANIEQQRHFVPEGRNIHAHAFFPGLEGAGHLKALELEPGALLRIQVQ